MAVAAVKPEANTLTWYPLGTRMSLAVCAEAGGSPTSNKPIVAPSDTNARTPRTHPGSHPTIPAPPTENPHADL